MTPRSRVLLIVAFSVLCVLGAVLLPATPQPLAYHDFADRRAFFGIPNFFDVASNALFLLGGVLGLYAVYRARFVSAQERWPYAIFFVGVTLTAIGSTYYHLAPDNQRLFWDRLPMAVAFMALICAQVTDRVSVRAGLRLLAPLVLVGVASVLYWRMTERAGAGNVIPYAVLQAWSVLVLVFIAALYRSRYSHATAIYWVFVVYLAAKIFESFDRGIYELTGFISGHTLKHLAAGVGGLIVARMIWQRVPAAGTNRAPLPIA